MTQSTIEKALNNMEQELKVEFQNRPPRSIFAQAPPSVSAPSIASLPLPEYVEHREGATEIGKLSAEGVLREYEAAATEIEAMGTELMQRVKECESMARDAFGVTEELKKTAARYREEAKRIFLQIESCSVLTAEVQKTCSELKKKIATNDPVKATKQKKR